MSDRPLKQASSNGNHSQQMQTSNSQICIQSHSGGMIGSVAGGGGPNSASMKSIESSMIALSVSLSSYLTSNKPGGEMMMIDLPQQDMQGQRKESCVHSLDREETEPIVKAVVIRASHHARNSSKVGSAAKRSQKTDSTEIVSSSHRSISNKGTGANTQRKSSKSKSDVANSNLNIQYPLHQHLQKNSGVLILTDQSSNMIYHDEDKKENSLSEIAEVPRNLLIKPQVEQPVLKNETTVIDGQQILNKKEKKSKQKKKSKKEKHQKFLINSSIPSDISSISQVDESQANAHQIKRYIGPAVEKVQTQSNPQYGLPLKKSRHAQKQPATQRELFYPPQFIPSIQKYRQGASSVEKAFEPSKADKSMLMQKLEEMTNVIQTYKTHKSNPIKKQQPKVEVKINHQQKKSEIQQLLETKYLKSIPDNSDSKSKQSQNKIDIINVKTQQESSSSPKHVCCSPNSIQNRNMTATFKNQNCFQKKCRQSVSSVERNCMRQSCQCQFTRNSHHKNFYQCSGGSRERNYNSCCREQLNEHLESHASNECPLMISFQQPHACQSVDMRCTPTPTVSGCMQQQANSNNTFSNIITLDDLAHHQLSLQSAGFYNPLNGTNHLVLTPGKFAQNTIPRPQVVFIGDSPSQKNSEKRNQQLRKQTESQATQTEKSPKKPGVSLSDYQNLVERYKMDNDELRKQLKEANKKNELLQNQVSDLSNEKIAWTRVEQTLKERIHKLQQEYYQAKVTTPQKQVYSPSEEKTVRNEDLEGSFLELKLDSLQNALETLESRFEQKEQELQCMSEICHSIESQNRMLQEQLSKSQEVIERQENEINEFRNEAGYFKEKMEEMQVVIDQCSQQMMDFDQINRMSSQLIEQLQNEVEYFKNQASKNNLNQSGLQFFGSNSEKAQKDYTFQRRMTFDNKVDESRHFIEIEPINQNEIMASQQLTPQSMMYGMLKNIHGASLLQSPLTPSQGQGVNMRTDQENNNTLKELNSYLEPTQSFTPERNITQRTKNSQIKTLNNRATMQIPQQLTGLATSESLPRFQHLQFDGQNQFGYMQPQSALVSHQQAPLNFQNILHEGGNGGVHQQPFTDLSNSHNINLMISRSESSKHILGSQKMNLPQHQQKVHLQTIQDHQLSQPFQTTNLTYVNNSRIPNENINLNSGFGHKQQLDFNIARLEQDHQKKMERYRVKGTQYQQSSTGRNGEKNHHQQVSTMHEEQSMNISKIEGEVSSLKIRR